MLLSITIYSYNMLVLMPAVLLLIYCYCAKQYTKKQLLQMLLFTVPFLWLSSFPCTIIAAPILDFDNIGDVAYKIAMPLMQLRFALYYIELYEKPRLTSKFARYFWLVFRVLFLAHVLFVCFYTFRAFVSVFLLNEAV